MLMLKEVSIDITGKKCLSNFNDLDIGWYSRYLTSYILNV